MSTPFPAPDELQHVSFAAYLQETGRWVGRYDEQKTLSADDFRVWTERPNYIGHPSPYYVFISWFLDRSLPPQVAVLLPRAASFGLMLAGLLAAVGARKAGWVFCAALVLCPAMLATGRQVNNDALGVLGGCLAYAAVARRLADGGWRRGALAGVGLAVALWAKPTAGLEVGFFLSVAMLLAGWRRVGWPVWLGVMAGGVVGVAVYVPIWLRYRAIVPVAVEMFSAVPHGNGFADYVPLFFVNVGSDWGFPRGAMAPWLLWLVALVFWAMLGWIGWGAWRRRSVPGMAGVAAFLMVLPIHFGFSAVHLGFSIPAASFRYYLPLWPALADGLACAVGQRKVAVAVVGAVYLLGWWA